MIQNIFLLAGLFIKVITTQSLQAYQRPVLTENLIKSQPTNLCCRDLSSAIQEFVMKNLRKNAYNTPIFGPMSGPLIDEIRSTLCSCPRCTSVNVLPKPLYSSGASKTANIPCSCGQPAILNSAAPKNCPCELQPRTLQSANPNTCSCNTKNCGCQESGLPILNTATPGNYPARVLNSVPNRNCACGNAPSSCSCNPPELPTVNPNVLYSLIQSGLVKVSTPNCPYSANSCSCGSTVAKPNTCPYSAAINSDICSCGPIVKSLNPNVYASLIQSGLLNAGCSCAVSNNGKCNSRNSVSGNPVMLNTANNVYSNVGCGCGRNVLV